MFGRDFVANDVNAFVPRPFEPNAVGRGTARGVRPVRFVRLTRMWIRDVAEKSRVRDKDWIRARVRVYAAFRSIQSCLTCDAVAKDP